MKAMRIILKALALLLLKALAFAPLLRGQGSATLDAYVEEARRNNLGLVQERLRSEQARSAAAEAQGGFLPRLSFEATYTRAEGGRTIDLPIGDLFNPVYGQLNALSGEERFPTDLENVNEQFLPDDFHETKLRLVQPLFNSDLYFNYKAKQALQSSQQAAERACLDALERDVKAAYYDYLMAAEAVEIYETTRPLLEGLLRLNRSLVRNGKATPEAVSDAEYELAQLESDRAEAVAQRQTARTYFNLLLDRELGAEIETDSALYAYEPSLSLEEMQQSALRSRAELQQSESGVRASEYGQKLQQYRALPTVSLVGDVGYQGFGYEFDQDQDFWLVQIGLSWNLFSGFQRRERATQARLETERLDAQHERLRQRIRLQVVDAFHRYRAAERQYAARASGLESARESFGIVRRRYENGQALLVEHLDARTRYTNARLQRAVARYALLKRRAELEYAAGL